jgi:hypothetical protein
MEINPEPYKCEICNYVTFVKKIYFGIIRANHTYLWLETLNLTHYLFLKKLKIYQLKKEINY